MKRPWLMAVIACLLLAACGEDDERVALPGYMEAELVQVSAETTGRVASLSVEEGGRVSKGDALYELESRTQAASVAAARGRLQEAEAALQLSKVSLERARDLRAKGFVAQARLDDAQSTHARNLASVAAARANLEESSSMLEKRVVAAPAAGSIEEIYFRIGEVVGIGQPVVAILPPGNLKVRFYVQEKLRASLKIGAPVEVACDGCPAGLSGRVSFIAREAEFTPPVIFSREERGKLVYLVEARPEGETAKLTAGQPVTVTLGEEPEAGEPGGS